MIRIEGLTKTYASGLQALKSVDLEIRRGEIFALLGPNGAGKTTLISIVCGIVTPTSGSVRVDGHDVIRDYRVTRANLTNVWHTTQHYYNLFVQDTWKLGDRLTLTPGIRDEQQTLTGSLADLTLDGNWAPRLGIVFDPTGEGVQHLCSDLGIFPSGACGHVEGMIAILDGDQCGALAERLDDCAHQANVGERVAGPL